MSTLITDVIQTNSNGTLPSLQDAAGNVTGQLCRAFVSFQATGGLIYDSFNVSSVTDNSSGDFTVNFSNTLPKSPTVAGISGLSDTGNSYNASLGVVNTGGVRVFTYVSQTGTVADAGQVYLTFFCKDVDV